MMYSKQVKLHSIVSIKNQIASLVTLYNDDDEGDCNANDNFGRDH